MGTPQEIVDGTDWGALWHAYGDASDTPAHLLALLGEDPEACAEALGHLDAAVLHQGTVYPATAPAARFVAAVLDDPRTLLPCGSALPWDERIRPLRAALLEWLGLLAESALLVDLDLEDDDAGDDQDEFEVAGRAAFRACQDLLPELFTAVEPLLGDTDPAVGPAALGAAAELLGHPALADRRAPLADRISRSPALEDPVARAGFAVTLSGWGVPPVDLLDDPHPGVRSHAAISPLLDDEPAATAWVRHALQDPLQADEWLDEPPPQLHGRLHFHLVAALLRRTGSFDEVVDEAVAIARICSAYTVGVEWAPLLDRAFPGGWDGSALSDGQRRFLTELLANEACWDGVADLRTWFDRLGLPGRRDELRQLVDAPTPRSRG